MFKIRWKTPWLMHLFAKDVIITEKMSAHAFITDVATTSVGEDLAGMDRRSAATSGIVTG